MADPHEYITGGDGAFHGSYPSQGDMYGPYESSNLYAKVRNTRIQIMENLQGQQTINPTVLVEDMLKMECPVDMHYEVIDIVSLLRKNIIGKRESEALQSIKTAVGVLEKYGRNLLKPIGNRPAKWKIIFFSNGVFKLKVGVVEGSKEILQKLGYVMPITDGLSFPDDVNKPNEQQVLRIVTDLIVAKVEIERYMNKLHPHPETISRVLHGSPFTSIGTDMYGPASGLARQEGPHVYSTASQSATVLPSLATLGSAIYGTAPPDQSSASRSQPQTQFPNQSVDQKPQGASLSSGDSDTDCNLCGEGKAAVYCKDCKNANCVECDKVWHSHPKRKGHKTEPLTSKVGVKTQPEPSVPDNYSQQIAAKLKRPPSTHFYENVDVSDVKTSHVAPPVDQKYVQRDRSIISPLIMESHEIKRPVPAPRRVSGSSVDEPSTPGTSSDGNSYAQLKSHDSSSRDSSVTSSSSCHVGASMPCTQAKPPKDLDEIKNKILRDSIAILQQVQVIQEKQDTIEDQDCDEYVALETEREVLMTRHKSLMKRKEALAVCDTVKRRNSTPRSKLVTPQQPKTEPKHTPEVSQPEPFQPLALNIKKPPVEDMLNITPTKPPASEKADPRRLDDGREKLQTLSEESIRKPTGDVQLPDPNAYVERHQASNQIMNPPTFYTPPTVPDPVPKPSVKPKPFVMVREESRQPDDAKGIARHTKEPSFAPAGGDKTSSVLKNEMPELGLQNPVLPMSSERGQTAGWECQYCTFWNSDTSSFICAMCSKTTYRNTAASLAPEYHPQGASAAAATTSLTGLAQQQTGAPKPSGFGIKMQKEEEEMFELKRRARLEDEIKTKSGSDEGSKTTKETFSHTFPRRTDVTKKTRKSDEFLPSLASQMTLTDMRIRTKQEETRGQGQLLVTSIRKAQCKHFDFDMIEVALNRAEDKIPIDIWLEENYWNFVDTVKVLVTNKLNDIMAGATMSDEQLQNAIHKHKGDIEKVEKECVEEFHLKIVEIKGLKLERRGHVLTADEILAELTKSRGNVEQMIAEVQKQDMKEFYDRIWQEGPDMKERFFDVPDEERERKMRILFAEYNLRGWGRTEHALELINERKKEILEDPEYYMDVIQAARDYRYLEEARHFLDKECSVCFCEFPMSRIIQSPYCEGNNQCLICKDCLKGHFTVCTKDLNILDASCPSCDIPKLMQLDKAEVSQYFATIDLMLRSVLDTDVYDLLHRKLRDRELFDDARFRWCLHCGSGFINERQEVRKMQCPDCKKHTCFECKKKWEPQHDNITCEEFEQWRKDNDPDLQAAGLARHLQENGIDCPKCKMRYDLAKGGCMHFRCTQCKHEFCCGCTETISAKCTRYGSCRKKGLHAHHPRDCLFYLRDLSVPDLQHLLQSHDVAFDTEPKQGERVAKCPVQEQKETPNGLTDEMCGKEVKGKNAGLCEVHYKEYLVGLINATHIDPAEIFDAHDLKICIARHEVHVPKRKTGENEDHYKQRLLQVVQERFPIG